MDEYKIHAEAYGTFVTTVQADSPEEAILKARSEETEWTLVDEPEVGAEVAVSCGARLER